MKKIVRLTESELMNLIGRIVKEQEEMEDDENAFDEHMITLDHIAKHYAIPENHPDIVSGRVASARDIYLQFMSLWDT